MYGNLRPSLPSDLLLTQFEDNSQGKRKGGRRKTVVRVLGTVVAKGSLEQEGRLRLIRVKLLDCGEWKLWGRRPLIEKAGGGSFGGTELTFARNRRAIIARLLIPS